MSQSFAESHVGVWKRRWASWVRARMDAVGEDNEESKRAKQIKQSWPDVADTITAAVNTAWMRKHPRPLSRHDVHFGSDAVITKVRDHQAKDAGKRSKAYERDDKETFAVGDTVRRMVARSTVPFRWRPPRSFYRSRKDSMPMSRATHSAARQRCPQFVSSGCCSASSSVH
jgi:hypothetical protein